MDSNSDKALMMKVKNGDLQKLGLLFERYHRQLYKYLYRMCGDIQLCEDLVQSVFERMLKYRSSYTGKGKFITWMYSIAHNAFIDHYRSQKRGGENLEFDEQKWKPQPDENKEFAHTQKRLMLEQCLQKLDHDKKEAIIMSRFEGLNYKEIAEVMNTTEGAVKVKIFRALRELKCLVNNLSEEYSNGKI